MVEIKTLAGLELFEGLPEEALLAIAAMSKELRFAPGTIIFSPELSSEWIFLLVEGSVRLTVFASALPEPLTIAVLTAPGQAFGFSSVVGQGHHNSSAEAVTAVRAIAIDGPPFLKYLEKEPAVGFAVMRRVARVISRRLAATRRLLLETIVDYERQATTTPEN
jgi:CRP-like cAMP-binding protein